MIELEVFVPLSPEHVWLRLIQNDHARQWWDPQVMIEPQAHGRVFVPWIDDTGEKRVTVAVITAIEEPRRLQMDLFSQELPQPMRVEFLISPHATGGSRIYLQHSGWEAIAEEFDRRRKYDIHADLWKDIINRFGRYCSGIKTSPGTSS